MKTQGAPILVVVSGPSGSGKTTACQNALAARAHLVRAITCTTRPPRPGERDGVDYYFLSPEQFQQRVQRGEFLEHATVYGQSYGTLKAEIWTRLREGHDVLLSVDVQGVASIRAEAERDSALREVLVTVFITPPSRQELERRLRGRGTEAPEELARRLEAARRELAQWRDFDYLLVSTTQEEDLRRLLAIIDAEKMRSCRVSPPDLE